MTKRTIGLVLAGLAATVVIGVTPGARDAAAVTSHAGKAKLKNRRKIGKLLRRKGLAGLPSVGDALSAGTSGGPHGAAVTGTPPALIGIGDGSIATLFWKSGVLDAIIGGSPSPSDCGQFWLGPQDGDSGGMGACRMAQDVGGSFGDVISGDSSLCYMKNLPTAANVAAGAVSLVSGNFPGGDPTRLFSVPSGSASRIVQVDVSGQPDGGQTVFLRVYSAGENAAASNLYAVDLWFCKNGGESPTGYDKIRIGTAGDYRYDGANDDGAEGGTHVDTVTGTVSFVDGRVIFDPTVSRRAQTASARLEGSYKADNVIAPDDTIASKSMSTYGGTYASYTVSAFSGSSTDDLRFLAGAFKQHDSRNVNDTVGSTEFRDTYYASSPGSALESRLSEVDLASDPFYATPPAATVDTTGLSCSASATVEVTVDFAQPAAAAVRQACEHHVWDHMQFCQDDPTVSQASSAVQSACYAPH